MVRGELIAIDIDLQLMQGASCPVGGDKQASPVWPKNVSQVDTKVVDLFVAIF
jgi:hypothetical protein